KFLDDLALELDRMRAVLSHGLSPRKPGSVSRFSPSPSVHPKGCTPLVARSWDPPVGKHTTPAPLDHAAGCQRPSPPRRDPLVQFRTFQVRTCRPLRDTLDGLRWHKAGGSTPPCPT